MGYQKQPHQEERRKIIPKLGLSHIMSTSTTSQTKHSVPIALSAEAVDDLIYDARAGDLEALNEDIANLASQHSCNESQIVASAIDMADESEGGSGSCVLHFPAANGNSGMSLNDLIGLGCAFFFTCHACLESCFFLPVYFEHLLMSLRNSQDPAPKAVICRRCPAYRVR